MDCTNIRANLFKYSEGTLSPDTHKAFETHIHSCLKCSEIIAEFNSFESLILKEKGLEPNAFAGTRILQSIESELESQQFHQHFKFLGLLQPTLVTVSLILALLIGFVIGRQGGLNVRGTAASTRQVEKLRSDLYITEFVDEEQIFLSDKK